MMGTPAMSGSTPRNPSPTSDRQLSAQSVAGSSGLLLNGDEFEHLGVHHKCTPPLLLNDDEWGRLDGLVTKASIYPISSGDLRMFRETYRKHCEVRSKSRSCMETSTG